jgi:NDP-sugar pyrophosphorylase family protein
MDHLIAQGKKVVAYPMVEYWLDIGRHDDYKKAQEDFNLINL